MPHIRDDAVFIADAHYTQERNQLIGYLNTLIANPVSQVFLMGDIFHLLIGHIPSSQAQNQPLIDTINILSQKTEVFYFEGNHDFGINTALFPSIKLYPRALQPALFSYQERYFLLAHGDIFLTRTYEAYICTLSNPLVLSLLKCIDRLSFGRIYQAIAKKINQKPIKSLKLNAAQLQDFSTQRLQKYAAFMQKNHLPAPFGVVVGVIEGHFHIGEKTQEYIALPSFACTQEVLKMEVLKMEVLKK
ncbi:hypothetical protein BKH46_08690 [Helicobacter sp. 12S02634-8]|nr:hypothetical protein BKH46_08690 [Helicobacter sp. 12S02634-8]